MNKFFQNKIALYLGLGLIVLGVGVGGFFGYQYLFGRTAAVVGGEKITKETLNDFAERYKKIADYNEDQNLKNNAAKEALDNLILEKALEQEAKKRGITITQAEIDAGYQELVKAYKDEEEYIRTIRSAYNWTPELSKRTVRMDLLKGKLEPYLIGGKDVLGAFVRWDWAGSGLTPEREKEVTDLSRQKIESAFLPLFDKNVSDEEIEKAVVDLQSDPDWPEPVTGTLHFKNLNTQTQKNEFAGPQDWEAISKLQNIGDHTGVVKSGGGYFVTYRLIKKSEGQFNSWDEFLENIKKSAKIYALNYQYQVAKMRAKGHYQKNAQFLKEKIAFFKPQKAEAAKINCTANHFSEFKGTVTDGSTGTTLSGVTFRATYGDIGTYPKCTTTEDGDYSVNSVSGGTFTIGTMKDPNKLRLSCWVRWDVKVTKSGYKPISYGEASLEANGTSTNLDNGLGRRGETYTGVYRTENTNNNGVIKLAPIPRPDAYYRSPKPNTKYAHSLADLVNGVHIPLRVNLADPSSRTLKTSTRVGSGPFNTGASEWAKVSDILPSDYSNKGLNFWVKSNATGTTWQWKWGYDTSYSAEISGSVYKDFAWNIDVLTIDGVAGDDAYTNNEDVSWRFQIVPPPPTGSLSCSSSTSDSISLSYSYTKATNPSLFREDGTILLNHGGTDITGSSSYTDLGLASERVYFYFLVNGTTFDENSIILASVQCETTAAPIIIIADPGGALSCASSTANSITLNYSLTNTSSGPLYRYLNGLSQYITSLSPSTSSNYTDSGLASSTSYLYDLYAANLAYLASVSCSTTTPPPPPLTCDFTANPSFGTLPLQVNFNAISSGGASYTYQWDFDYVSPTLDNNSSAKSPTYAYIVNKTYKVWLRVVDNNSRTCNISKDITVNPWSVGKQKEVAP